MVGTETCYNTVRPTEIQTQKINGKNRVGFYLWVVGSPIAFLFYISMYFLSFLE